MKTRKQLPAFGYLSNFQIDTARLIEHLQNSDIKDDINNVLSKIRDSKINSILDERPEKFC